MRQRKTIPFVQETLRDGKEEIDEDEDEASSRLVAEKQKNSSLARQIVLHMPLLGKETKIMLFYVLGWVVLFCACFLLWKNLFVWRSRDEEESELLVFSPMRRPSDTYHVNDCPETPPPGYPREYPILDVLLNWNTGETSPKSNANRIYQGICIFDIATVTDPTSTERNIQN